MLKKIVVTAVTGGMLLFGMTAFALTLDDAKANIDKQATEKKLGAADHSQAVATLQGLVDKGVPVEHAYNVVEASINQGIKGKDLAAIAKSIEANGPGARKDAAAVATEAIQHKYTVRETVRLMNTFGKTVAAGAPADRTSQVMTSGISKGLGGNKVVAVTKTFAGEVKSGVAPGTAADNATRAMDRDRPRTQDRDRDRQMTHDRMGSGPGMDHSMGSDGMGSGMGPGAGSGMGGPRR